MNLYMVKETFVQIQVFDDGNQAMKLPKFMACY